MNEEKPFADLKVCCDCLRILKHLSPDEFDRKVIIPSQLDEAQQRAFAAYYGTAKERNLAYLYLCADCYKKRFLPRLKINY